MNSLIIDTSDRYLVLAVVTPDRAVTRVLTPTPNTSSAIVPSVEALLTEVGLKVSDMQLIAAVVGPGSFTGIRIGVSVANALGYGLSARRLAVGRLDVLAWQLQDTWAAVPSRPGYSYTKAEDTYAEHSLDEVARHPSIGLEGSGARIVLSAQQYADKLVDYVLAHADRAGSGPMEPVYLKKSQAERTKGL